MSKEMTKGESENLEKSRKNEKPESLMRLAISLRIWKVKIRFEIEI